jgi:hypothetical protein
MSHRFPPLAAQLRTTDTELWLFEKLAPLRRLPFGEVMVFGALLCTLITA